MFCYSTCPVPLSGMENVSRYTQGYFSLSRRQSRDTERWFMKKLIFSQPVLVVRCLVVSDTLHWDQKPKWLCQKAFLFPKLSRQSKHYPNKCSGDLHLLDCSPSVWSVPTFPLRLKILATWMSRSWLCTPKSWSCRRVPMQGAKERSWRACKSCAAHFHCT